MLRVSVLWGLSAMQGMVLSAVNVRADAVADVRAISSQIAQTFSVIEQGELWVQYRCDYDSLKPGLETNLPWMEMTFATAGGKKFYGYHRAPHRQLNRTSVVIVQESAFDGAVNTDRTDMQGFVNEKTWGAYWLDEYLQGIGYAVREKDRDRAIASEDELQWLPHCLMKRPYSVRAEGETINEVECIVVECPGQDCLWLARNLGLVLVKRELRRARDAAIYRRWVNSEFVGFPGGVWLPKRSEREFWTEEEATNTPTCRVRLVAEDVRWQAEPDVTRSYRLTFASGTQVLDEIKGVYYRVNARGLPILENSIIDARANLSSQAALAPSLWISLAMTVGGLGMVLIAWLVWRRGIYS